MDDTQKIPSVEQFQSSRLNVQVSCFRNYESTECEPVILWKWLLSNKHKEKQAEIRSISDKNKRDKQKATLPAITPAALVNNRVKGNNNYLISPSGFLCIDIDKKDNQNLNNYDDLLQQLPNIANIIYAGESVSGTGYFALIPISNPDNLEQHFRAVEKLLFKYFNIKVDPTKGKNYKDLRGYSFTENPYFNLNAETFTQIYVEQPKSKHSIKFTKTNALDTAEGTLIKIENLIRQLERREIDLTKNYSDWFIIGMSLANLGDAAREYFHRASKHYPNYEYNKTNEQFTHCLKSFNGSININSFFHLCKNAGIWFDEDLKSVTTNQEKP